MTTEEKKEADHQYYLQNTERIKKRTTEWNEKNRKYHREYNRRWERKYPGKRRNSYLKRAYKLSLKEYEEIKAIQEGRCAICLEVKKRLVVDHNHKTNQIRSLLCTTCNAGIGQFRDNIELLAQAIAYLKRHEIAQSTTVDSQGQPPISGS